MSKRTARFGSLMVGEGFPVRVMWALNVSPESFYKGSVVTAASAINERVAEAVESGAELVDVGAMSSAPYLSNEISEEREKERIAKALDAISGVKAVISVDTMRSSVAELALRMGASVVNDVSGLKNDEAMAMVVKKNSASLLAMAHSKYLSDEPPVARVRRALRETLSIAKKAGVEESRIVLDPGIGFFREKGAGRAYSPQRLMPWQYWDSTIIHHLSQLRTLGRPLGVGLSRKSFIGKLLGIPDASQRLPASLAAAAIAVVNGADLIRTHDVWETVQAIRIAEAIIGRGPQGAPASL